MSCYLHVLSSDLARARFEQFNRDDEVLHPSSIPNAAAFETIGTQIPMFECPDEDITRTYYFRWWTYRKHLRRTADGTGWVVTEFSPDVGWAGPENTISCSFGHHMREGRWLRDVQYLDSYAAFMLAKGRINGPGSYTNWPAWSILERAKVTGDFDYAIRELNDCMKNFEAWEKGWTVTGLSLRDVENVQGAKGVEIATGFHADRGLFDFCGNFEGSEFALSHDGARPLTNCAMWAEAKAISEIARRAHRPDFATRFAERAASLEKNIKGKLWNRKKQFFTVLSVKGELDDVCELHGYAPWYFGMDLSGFENAWLRLIDKHGFAAPKGLTFPTQDTPGFDVKNDPDHHECMWNGPSWPYATSFALTALCEAQRRYPNSHAVRSIRFSTLLRQYAAQHTRALPDGRTIPWIDENLDPFTGEWTAREHLLRWSKQGRCAFSERGKDYNHSTFCDLVIEGLCGLVPQEDDAVVVKPLAPNDWNWWCVDGIRYHGHDITILYDRDGSRYHRGPGLIVLRDGTSEQYH